MDFWSLHLPIPVALAAVATLGYLVGRRKRDQSDEVLARSRREIRRAQAVARELETIAWKIRRNLSRHHTNLARFKQRLGRLKGQEDQASWKELCREADHILTPTLRLATQIADAYDQIRQQSNSLLTFTEVRTDPLTGVGNRRSLDETLATQFAMWSRYGSGFSLAIFDIDHFKRINDEQGHLQGDQLLQRVARLLDESIRETDIVSRYGGEEFVVIMPQTGIVGATGFTERVRERIEEEFKITVSGGVAEVLDGDDVESLIARADAALYAAKNAGRNRVYRHTGLAVEPAVEEEMVGSRE